MADGRTSEPCLVWEFALEGNFISIVHSVAGFCEDNQWVGCIDCFVIQVCHVWIISNWPIQWSAPTQPCGCSKAGNPLHCVGHGNAGEQTAKLETSGRLLVRSSKLVGKICIEDGALIFTEHTFLWSSVDFIIWASIGHFVRAFWLI